MKILIDADACPVTKIIIRLARERGIPVVLIVDDSHEMQSDWAEVVTVGRGRDAVDLALINRTDAGDIVVTQDYGVAALALGKRALAIHQSGMRYTEDNIDMLLNERHLSGKARRAGSRAGGCRKRTAQHDERFARSFVELLDAIAPDAGL